MNNIIYLISQINNESYQKQLYKKIKISNFILILKNTLNKIYNKDDKEIAFLNFLYNYCIIIIIKDIYIFYKSQC